MAKHAILSASGSERWLNCPPSARLEERITEEKSEYAAEGTFAHKLAELHLQNYLKLIKKVEYDKKLKQLKENEFYSQEMEDYIQIYIDIAIEKINEAKSRSKDAIVFLEQQLDFSPWVPEGFGTGDVVIISDEIVEVVDFKYGKGVPVSAEENTQMRLYGLGAVNLFNILYDIKTIRMTIVQPRLDSVSTESLSVKELLIWGDTTVKPKAKLAFKGEGEFQAGDHCRFCRAKATCRARAEANLELARYDFQDPALLSNDEIAEILFKADELKAWAADIQTYALEQAYKHGIKFDGWKLVEGRSNRKYTDEEEVAKILIEKGYKEDDLYTKSILGITAMEKLLGKKKFGELLDDLVIKPPGKPTLVPEGDKRPELSSAAAAIKDFK
jgi:hypothetical protein